jgi:ABC-2 type transport system ATP-binding protein
MLAIEAVGLHKRFGTHVAVDHVDLAVPAGAVYGVLGPNGAGKTTTIRMLATLLRPDGGRASVFGHDVRESPSAVRGRISLTGQYASVDDGLTGRENLLLVGRLLGHTGRGARRRADQLLEAFELSAAADRLVSAYSGGMRRRLDIATSVVVVPDLLVLDEPTTGLDPRSRNAVWDVVRTLTASGATVLLTTQYLEEADRLADRLAVIDGGRVIAEGTTGELKESIGAGSLQLRLRDPADDGAAQEALVGLGLPVQRDPDPGVLTVLTEDLAAAGAALSRLAEAGIGVAAVSAGQPSLDDVFFALTGHAATATGTEVT